MRRGSPIRSAGPIAVHVLETRRLLAGPVAEAGGPYFVNEGGMNTLFGSATGTITKWEWDFDYSAAAGFQTDFQGQHAQLNASNLDGPLTLTVALRVTDNQNQTHIDTASLNVQNVAPFCNLAVASTDTGVATTARVSNINEPSVADRESLLFSYDFDGDNLYDLVDTPLTTVEVPATFLNAVGNPLARVKITDKDGGSRTASKSYSIAPGYSATINASVPSDVWEASSTVVSGAVGSSNLFTLVSYGWDVDYDGITFHSNRGGSSFQLPPIDGPAQRTVAFRVIDSSGRESIDTHAFTIHNSPPTVGGRTGPTSVAEGSTGTLFGVSGATDPNASDAANLRFSFDTDGDGTFDVIDSLSPETTIPASAVPDGPSSVALKARVSDDDGGFTDYTFPLTVTNVLPVITLNGPTWIRAGQAYPLTIAYSDVGQDSPRRIVVDWGDGVEEQLAPGVFEASHVLTQVRQQNIIVRVTDDDVTRNSAKFISVEGQPTLQSFTFAIDGPIPPAFVPFGIRGPRLNLTFAARTGSEFDASSLVLSNLTTGEVIPTAPGSSGFTFLGGPNSDYDTWYWTGGLPDGEYRATLPAGSVLGADGQPSASDTVLEFHILAGDLNRDRRVDFDDLLILAQNYGKTRQSFGQGNVNYSADGTVDFDDLLLLAQRYGTTLSVIATSTLTTAAKRRGNSDLIR